jgi:TetR/AcrR family transcriptional repressor of mexJK operon
MDIETATVAPPPAEPSRKRRKMLDAATALFMKQGYGAVSMDAVARAADVSKATLYAHFASKDALFATIVGDACCLDTVDEASFYADPEDVGATLRVIGGRFLRYLLEPETLARYRVVVSESARFPELGAAFWVNGPLAFRKRLAEWVARQCEVGRLVAEDADVAAEQFIGLLRSGVFMRASLAVPPAPDRAEIDATVEAAVATFLRAFAPRG